MAKRPAKKFPLLPRKPNADKFSFGHVLVVAGSRGMMGAGALTARAALSAGAGLVSWALPRACENFAAAQTLELMRLPLASTPVGSIAYSAKKAVTQFVYRRRISVCAVGPGLSVSQSTTALARALYRELKTPCVFDADALNAFRGRTASLKEHAGPRILTPHPGEFRRLFGIACPGGIRQREALAKKLSAIYDVTLVLKGHPTLVVSGLRVYRNRTGNPSMAKGGSGDVLTGIIGAFLAQGLSLFEAASWAVYFHGLSGDLARRKRGELSVNAGDLICFLPAAFKKI